MDELAKYNKERWEALAQADVMFSRPFLDLDVPGARAWLAEQPPYVQSALGEVARRDVLCLAGSGGQQTAVFGLLKARVTVFDLSETQLARDRKTAAHYGYPLAVVQGDMRDLSCFEDDSFDIIWQPYSINFVPDARQVLDEVGRIIRPGGFYKLDFGNPFWSMEEHEWDGSGYPIKQPYEQGAQFAHADPHWDVEQRDGSTKRIVGPHEFIHTLGTIINGLVENGFIILGFSEGPEGDAEAEPGSWEHMIAYVKPFFSTAGRKLSLK